VISGPAVAVGDRAVHPLVAVAVAAGGGIAIGLAVALGPAPVIVVAGLLGILVAIGIAQRPTLAIPIAVGIVYSNAVVVAAQFHGAPIALALVIPALLVIPVLDLLVARRAPVVGLPLLGLAAAYLLVLVLAAIAARNPPGAAEELWRFVTEGAVLYILLLQGVRTPRLLWSVIGVLLVVGGVLGLLSVIQQATGAFDETFLGFARSTSQGFEFGTEAGTAVQQRVGGPIGEQNRYGQVMLALVPLGIVALRHARGWAVRIAVGVLLVFILAAVALTYSRGAALTAVILIAALIPLRLVSWRGFVAVVAIGILAIVVVPGLGARLLTLEDVTAASDAGDRVISQRLNDMLTAFLVFTEHPLLGIGPGQFSTVYLEYSQRVPGLAGVLDFEAHTLYGEVAAETGLLGIITFFGLIGGTLVLLVRARRNAVRVGRRDLADLAAGFILVIVVHLGTGLFLHLSYPRYFWVPLGLAAAAAVVVTRESRPRAAELPAGPAAAAPPVG